MTNQLRIQFFLTLFILPFCYTVFAEELVQQENNPIERKVILQRMYLDGELSEEKLTETIWTMEDFWLKYQDWNVVDQNEDQIVLKKIENDISPLLKANGYLGMKKDGTLSIFIGRPEHAKIIHTFYQIDVGKLEVYKQEELQKGIPIVNKDQYKQLIKEYEPYSVN
ncbi:intercompartmental signaling factor BofC [Peribacillus butanolivorans]|uniref:intercompartmental signaling factor BofC n=1 Tax=Peribacillus butanolivorans TaxID=421767 RepID=UPI00207C9DF4|nr:intercompartmental signaling factor BofC [Peribacillus butanolivorans]MCO0597867.1 intercompartmental signaling factor BofC [Peribacillus butanolivorans]